MLELLAGHGDDAGNLIPVAIETPRGLLTACLRAAGRQIYPINPMAVARYRDRHSVAGRKSDHGDAVVLANILRTDLHAHRPLPAGTAELAQAIAVLARAQQDAVWDRIQAHNKLRSHLREYFPGFLAAFTATRAGIARPEARTILAAAPTPAAAAALSLAQLRALLKKACRSRGIDAEAQRLRESFRIAQMRHPPLVQAMGRQTLALLRQLDAACASAEELEQAAIQSFNLHPDAGIITSFPGLGALTGTRVLAETGDDRSRFQDAKGLKAYAGAPHHPRQRQDDRRHPPADKEQPARSRRIQLGTLGPHRITRRPRPLRPPA